MESGTGSRLAAGVALGCAAIAFALTDARAETMSVVQRGLFALLGARPAIVAYAKTTHSDENAVTLSIRQFMSGGEKPILHYDVDMEMLMHLIVVRDDFGTFVHLHPAFDNATGLFEQSFSRDNGHRYYAFADSAPRGIGEQVFRFTVDRDGTTNAIQPSPAPFAATPSPLTTVAGPYGVTLASATWPARQRQTVKITISEGGKPANDLDTYLGAAAHAVLVDTASLSYVHVHPSVVGAPMEMDAPMTMRASPIAGPRLRMELPPLPAGTYKLWIEFRGKSGLYTAPFTILSR